MKISVIPADHNRFIVDITHELIHRCSIQVDPTLDKKERLDNVANQIANSFLPMLKFKIRAELEKLQSSI